MHTTVRVGTDRKLLPETVEVYNAAKYGVDHFMGWTIFGPQSMGWTIFGPVLNQKARLLLRDFISQEN